MRPVLDMFRRYGSLGAMAIIVFVVLSQGAGLQFGGALRFYQGSFSIVLVGVPLITIVPILRNGRRTHPMTIRRALISRKVWSAGWQTLRWSSFSKPMKLAIISLAVTSTLINVFGPKAVQELGGGMNAAFATAGSLAAGVLALRYLPQWLARGVALVAVLLAAKLSGDGGFTLFGLFAAVAAASHMWNLPKRIVALKPRQDEGLAVANLISAPFVLTGTWGYDRIVGNSWSWGMQEIFGALCAGFLVMVIPVFLQNLAAELGMTEQDQGAMAALAPPLHALVGWVLAPITLVIAGTAAVQPNLNQVALFVILAMAAVAAPLMPKSKPGQTEAALKEATAKLSAVEAKLSAVNAEKERANAESLRLQQELEQVNRRRHAAELAAQHGLSVSDVEDLQIAGLSDDLVVKVAQGRIRPFLVHWLRQLGYDPAKSVEVAAELPKRGWQWYKGVLAKQRSSLVYLSRDEAQVLLVLLSGVAPEARRSLQEALGHRPSAHRDVGVTQ